MKKRMMKLLAGMLAAAMLTGCGGNADNGSSDAAPQNTAEESAAEQENQADEKVSEEIDVSANTELDMAYNLSCTTLDPFNNENRYPVLDMIYMMLFQRSDFGGELQYGLCDGYEQTDAYTYVFHIRDNVVDSLGNPTTAEDVAWSYNYCKENGNISKAQYIESCEVTGENEVTMVLNSDELNIMVDVTTAIWVCSQKSYESLEGGMVTAPVGATGYKVVSFTPGTDIVLEREENWWGDDCSDLADQYARNIGRIHIYFITEASQIQTALETGTVQTAFQVSDYITADFSDLPGYGVESIQSNTPLGLLFNCSENSICSNLYIRQAISYCINRDAIIANVTYGKAMSVRSLGGDFFDGYQESWNNEDYYDYNIEKAKECLELAGYQGEEIRVMIENNPNHQKAVETLQASCLEAGINLTILTYEKATVNSYKYASSGEYDIYYCSTISSNYMSSLFRYYLDANQYDGATMNGIKDEKLQELVELANNEETMTDEVIDELHQYVKDNCYEIGIYAASRHAVSTDGIKGVFFTGHAQVAPNAYTLSSDWNIMAQ